MPAGPWTLYNEFLFNEGNKQIDLTNDIFKVALFAAGSTVANKAVVGAGYTALAAAGGEVANGNGYTTGGYQVVVTWTGGAAQPIANFSTTNPEWPASGSGFSAGLALLYDDTAPGKLAVAYCQLDTTDVVVAPGKKLKIQITKIFADTQA
jgi:hypothetical protein